MVDIPLQGKTLEEVCRGMMFASLAITDSKENTLANVGKFNPWHIEALKVITGSEQQAHQPLKKILHENMGGLILDCELNISGVTKGAHFLDTQGYIAHNDRFVVVAFRCTTSAFDWLTNLNTSSSVWELDEDIPKGDSGFCSAFDDLCYTGENHRPRVHTGFYNNFLASIPIIKDHIDPYLVDNETPRTLYVTGHSLGAGIATLTACYFLLEYDWSSIAQYLVVVTAGSPRACTESMKEVIDNRRQMFGDKTKMHRLVKGRDVVATVPPRLFGFRHLVEPTCITDNGQVILRSKDEDSETQPEELSRYSIKTDEDGAVSFRNNDTIEINGDEEENINNVNCKNEETKYERKVKKIPKVFRDHMPDFYLKALLNECTRLKENSSVISNTSSWVPKVVKKKKKESTFDMKKLDLV